MATNLDPFVILQDQAHTFWSDGTVLPRVMGGSGEDDAGGDGTDDGADDAGDDDDENDATKPPKNETPEQENERLRAALRKANSQARKHRLAAKAVTTAKVTEGDDLEAKIKAARDEERELANTTWGKRLIKTEARAALAQAGAINAARAVGLLNLDEIDLDDDGDVIGLDDAIKDLRKEMPLLFGSTRKGTDHKENGEGPASGSKPKTATELQADKLQGRR